MADSGRIVLVLTSPRVAPGLLAWPAWDQLRAADVVLAADPGPQWLQALADGGVEPVDVVELPVAQRAGRLVELGVDGATVAWCGSPDGDPGLTDALAEHLARHAIAGYPPEVEVIVGSYDTPGARVLDLVAVMNILRSPGGCPWDAEQTHLSLLPYLLEETHEVIEAIESGDRDHLVEELGDLLLQVVFHARIGEEGRDRPFDVDEIAAGVVDKLVRRHPHVFAEPGSETTPPQASVAWEELKAQEKGRKGPFEGIPASLPSLARAQKMLDRLQHAAADLPAAADLSAAAGAAAGDSEVAGLLLAAVLRAREVGVDAESVLRAALARFPTG